MAVLTISQGLIPSGARIIPKELDTFNPLDLQSSNQTMASLVEKMKINPKSPQGQDVSRFLADLSIREGLSYNTILLHRSAITTFCAGGPASDSSTGFLVRRTLKAISITRPREIKSHIWDARILLNSLSKPTVNFDLQSL